MRNDALGLERTRTAMTAMSKSIVALNQRVQELERRLALAEAHIETINLLRRQISTSAKENDDGR